MWMRSCSVESGRSWHWLRLCALGGVSIWRWVSVDLDEILVSEVRKELTLDLNDPLSRMSYYPEVLKKDFKIILKQSIFLRNLEDRGNINLAMRDGSSCDHYLWCHWSVTDHMGTPHPKRDQTCSLRNLPGTCPKTFSNFFTWTPTFRYVQTSTEGLLVE